MKWKMEQNKCTICKLSKLVLSRTVKSSTDITVWTTATLTIKNKNKNKTVFQISNFRIIAIRTRTRKELELFFLIPNIYSLLFLFYFAFFFPPFAFFAFLTIPPLTIQCCSLKASDISGVILHTCFLAALRSSSFNAIHSPAKVQ